MSTLTAEQIAGASKLFQERPAVIPGTRVIFDDNARNQWYLQVANTAKKLGVKASDHNSFCDLAGVPD